MSRGSGIDRSSTASRPGRPAALPAALVVAALAAYIACAAFVISSDPWDPLSGWGLLFLFANSLAIGLAGQRWPVLLAPLALVALVPLNRLPSPELGTVALYGVAGICAVLVALGIGLRALARRRGARADRRAAGVGFALICLTSALTGWGIYLDQRVVDRTPSTPLLIDQRSGTFRGIAPGIAASRVRSLFGRPVLGDEDRAAAPLGQDPGDISGPSSMQISQAWRYRELVVFVADGRVLAYLTTDRSAQTAAGVGVGDSLVIAERAYAGLDCSGMTLVHDAVRPSYLVCTGALPSGDQIWFGGDPIDSIWVLGNDPNRAAIGPPIVPRSRG